MGAPHPHNEGLAVSHATSRMSGLPEMPSHLLSSGRLRGEGRREPLPSQEAAGLLLGALPQGQTVATPGSVFFPSSVHSRPSPGKGHQLSEKGHMQENQK